MNNVFGHEWKSLGNYFMGDQKFVFHSKPTLMYSVRNYTQNDITNHIVRFKATKTTGRSTVFLSTFRTLSKETSKRWITWFLCGVKMVTSGPILITFILIKETLVEYVVYTSIKMV